MSVERFAVIGDPIAHSRSPLIMGAAFAAAGIPAEYQRRRVPLACLDGFLAAARRELRGFNVTIPLKEAVAARVDDRSPLVERTGAANTVIRRGERLEAHNTDVEGFGRSLDAAGIEVRGRNAVVFGAGGSARAVACALLERGARVTLAARTPGRAEAVRQALGGAITVGPQLPLETLADADTALAVNATPLGMAPFEQASPLPQAFPLPRRLAIYDLVYGRETPLLVHARRCGCAAIDGAEMLLQQAAAAFYLWTGQEADLGAMRSALEER